MFVVIGKLSFFLFFNSYSALSSKLLFTVNLSKKTTMTMGFSFKLSNHLNQLFLPAKAFFCFSVKNKNFFVSIRKKKLCILHSDARIFFFFWGKDKLPENPQKASAVKSKKVVYRLPQTSSSSSKGGTWITIFTRPIVRQSTLKSKGLFQ